MINIEELVLQAREHLTELPESVIVSEDSLAALVPSAIAVWQLKTAKDRNKRQNFVVKSEPLTVTDGELDLSAAIETYGFRLDMLEEGDLEFTGSTDKKYGIKFIASRDRLKFPGIQDKFFTLAHLSGTTIQFRDPAAVSPANPLTSLNGEIIIRSVVLPKELTDIPYTVLPELALELADLARRQFNSQNRGLNIPPKR